MASGFLKFWGIFPSDSGWSDLVCGCHEHFVQLQLLFVDFYFPNIGRCHRMWTVPCRCLAASACEVSRSRDDADRSIIASLLGPMRLDRFFSGSLFWFWTGNSIHADYFRYCRHGGNRSFRSRSGDSRLAPTGDGPAAGRTRTDPARPAVFRSAVKLRLCSDKQGCFAGK